MEVKLGADATILPGSELHVQGTGAVQSANAVSHACTSRFTVQVPEMPVRPSITVSGISVVDRCSDTHIEATSNSPRALTYKWSSSDSDINEQLRGYTGAMPVYDLQVLETLVSIYVYGVDFLQQASEVAEFVVTRQSGAVPQISFYPPTTVTFADQDVLISAQAKFSECNVQEAQLLFEWSQVSQNGLTIPAGVNIFVCCCQKPYIHTYTHVHTLMVRFRCWSRKSCMHLHIHTCTRI
jgi:hypothetical protein